MVMLPLLIQEEVQWLQQQIMVLFALEEPFNWARPLWELTAGLVRMVSHQHPKTQPLQTLHQPMLEHIQ